MRLPEVSYNRGRYLGVMTDTVDDVDLPYEDGASQQEKVAALEERLEILEQQNEEMRDKLLDANAENNKYQQKLERLTHENKKLKQSPLFVATVQELTDEGVVIKQHGNNQEALTEVTDEMRESLDPDDRVAVNNSLSVVKRLDDETDVRARVMQVEQSPAVAYEDIGGIDEQMEEVRETVEMPIKDPGMFDEVGIDPPSGVLLHGPPGTGKTMLAKAVANLPEHLGVLDGHLDGLADLLHLLVDATDVLVGNVGRLLDLHDPGADVRLVVELLDDREGVVHRDPVVGGERRPHLVGDLGQRLLVVAVLFDDDALAGEFLDGGDEQRRLFELLVLVGEPFEFLLVLVVLRVRVEKLVAHLLVLRFQHLQPLL